jgi:hypothetical protein
MAKKKNDGFDPDGFIESVRASSVPTYHTAADSQAPDAPPIKEDISTSPETYDDYDTERDARYSELNMTADEIDFIKKFIADGRFRRVSRNGRQVFIRERHLSMILGILGMLDEEANISTYIDKVLTEHFRKYYPIIQGISKKCPSKIL